MTNLDGRQARPYSTNERSIQTESTPAPEASALAEERRRAMFATQSKPASQPLDVGGAGEDAGGTGLRDRHDE